MLMSDIIPFDPNSINTGATIMKTWKVTFINLFGETRWITVQTTGKETRQYAEWLAIDRDIAGEIYKIIACEVVS